MKKIYLSVSLFLLICGYAIAQPTVPPNPLACNASTCTTNANIDVCQGGNNVISNFQNGTVFTNNGNSGLSVGSTWRFRNVATVVGTPSVTVNVLITIDAISNAVLDNIDDDGADDQSGNSIASFFAPRIGPDQSLNSTSRRGYVQFTAAFFKNSTGTNNNTNSDFAVSVSLANINYVHYDIDGSAENSANPSAAWFRETGVAKRAGVGTTNPVVLANASTELVPYNYTDGGFNWTGFAGSVCERSGVSRCAEVASSFSYAVAQPSITFRMGYDFKADANGYNFGNTVRQYGSRFGCFNFPQQITLPVKLLSFNGAYNNQHTLLNWSTENEQNFDHFEIERSNNGFEYSSVGIKASQGSTSRSDYEFNDDLSSENSSLFYYRLKIVDRDGKYTYSKVVLIKKDNKSINGITINPNPIINGTATVKMTSPVRSLIELRVVDISGRVLLKQTQNVYEGNNAITIDVQKLQPGIYTMQVAQSEAMISAKFSIVK